MKYLIKIPSISYVREGTGTSHTIQTDVGLGVKLYDVEVISISVCGSESELANLSLKIQVSGE